MAVSATSPNVDNYFIGKGIVKFKKTGDVDYRDLGNCPEVEFTPSIETKDHFSSRSGTQTKDRKVVMQKSATLRIVMEEMTPDNLALILMGDVTPSSPEFVIDILSLSEITGAARFVGQNDIGARVQYDWPNVSITPSGSLNLIGDDWGSMEITADVLADVNGSFGQALWNITDEVTTITA